MEELEIWLARDKDNSLWVHQKKPIKSDEVWDNSGYLLRIDNKYFPNIKWEDKEPTKAKIVLIK